MSPDETTNDLDSLDDLGPVTPGEMTLNFEAVISRIVAGVDGTRLTLVVHPQDASLAEIYALGLKTRLYISALPIDDNEQPVPTQSLLAGIRAVRRTGIVCREPEFWAFAKDRGYISDEIRSDKDACRLFVRAWCRVRSRSDLKFDRQAQVRLDELILEYGKYRQRNCPDIDILEGLKL
jgi:hypothetical protein